MMAGEQDPSDPLSLTRTHLAGIALISVVYFADIFLKASQKCFWFDELFTVYLCRLPRFSDTWTAVLHGADFNPPLLYLLTRGGQLLFGDGLIGTRLPAIVGVWLFGVCLFLFVAKRTGIICGLIAGVFPFFTLAQYYAYEARAHGITLGWCGLALLCWQRNSDGRAKYLWLAGFGLSLFAALLTHVYAIYLLVPFAIVELYSLLNRHNPNWGIVLAMLLALIPVTSLVYLRLFRIYRGSIPPTFAPTSHDSLQRFLVDVTGPAIVVLLLWLLLCALNAVWPAQNLNASASIPPREMVLAAGFACIPLVGAIGCKVSHGPFIDRYFLSSIAGYSIALGFAMSRRQVPKWTSRTLAACMLCLMVADLGSTAYLSVKKRIVLIEPSSGFALTTYPAKPMLFYDTISNDESGLDILVLPRLEYLYFFRYAPSSVVSHLYFGAPTNDFFIDLYERLARGARLDLKTTTFAAFLATHDRFLVYGRANSSNAEAIQAFAAAGYSLKSAQADTGGVMYEYAK